MDTTDLQDPPRRDGEADFNLTLLKALVDATPAGVLVADASSGRILFVNAQLRRMLRVDLRPEQVVKSSEWRGFHRDGRPIKPAEWPLMRALEQGEQVEPEELVIVRGDHTRAVVRLGAVPVRDSGGRVVAGLATCQDISDQQQRYVSRKIVSDVSSVLASTLDPVTTLRNIARLVVPSLADWCAIDLVDDGTRIERVAVEHIDRRKARAAAELARRNPPTLDPTVGVGKVIREGKSELVREVTPEIIEAYSRTPRLRKLLEELGVRSLMMVPLIARSEPLGAITFVSAESGRIYDRDDLDLAEELASRAALAIENSRLYEASRAASEAKSDFLAVMSHELRTPLTAIIGYAELLQLGVPEPVTPRQNEQAERIEVSARHLLQLIEEILTLVTLDSGESRVRNEDVKVSELIKRAVAIIEPMARAKSLPLEVNYPEEDVVLHSDPDKLLQILLNLLSNSVKFTETGEIGLRARIDGDTLVFDIVDTGIGLGPEDMKRIFEPFWQVERPITRRAGGTGLGLTISRRLADLLGAEIQVESTVNKGSTFSVRVPIS